MLGSSLSKANKLKPPYRLASTQTFREFYSSKQLFSQTARCEIVRPDLNDLPRFITCYSWQDNNSRMSYAWLILNSDFIMKHAMVPFSVHFPMKIRVSNCRNPIVNGIYSLRQIGQAEDSNHRHAHGWGYGHGAAHHRHPEYENEATGLILV